MEVKIDPSWQKHLAEEFEKPYFAELTEFVKKEYKDEVVYPPPKYIFRAFDLCPFKKVKVVILGQDPYHGKRQANGLAFAVDENIAVPPSLQNIFKEIEDDLGDRAPRPAGLGTSSLNAQSLSQRNGDLVRWCEQGVLLLNATLTVRAQMAGSHQGRGWELFTDAVIKALSEEREHLVFMLWGNYAKAKGAHIDRTKHLVLEAPHPSPFSAASGFFGCKHFGKANDYLIAHNETPIDWL
ncbi:MAG: uracil-DNA glycosylase [Candidatus Kaiserbacteria bacterium]|nr:uracil-DNA glycosylase [Candidatus Kaiserbacteria bacterium]